MRFLRLFENILTQQFRRLGKRFFGPVCKQKLCSWCFRFPAQCWFQARYYIIIYMHIRNGLEAAQPAEQHGFRNHQGIEERVWALPRVSMTDTKPNTFWDAIADGRPDHLSWILKKCDTQPVSQLWRHTGGRSFAAAFFLFKLAYGKAAYQIPEWFVLFFRKQWEKTAKRSAKQNLNAPTHIVICNWCF